MSAYKTLEHHEHAEHILHAAHAEGGGHDASKARHAQLAALLVATLAAGLAISEQGAKHAEIRTQLHMINATDAWAQYQAKSTRAIISQDIVRMIGVMDPPAAPDLAARRDKVIETMNREQDRFEHDPKDGKEAIAHRAHAFEHERDHALEQTHAYHNGSALMELGIVLSTASAIIGSRLLIVMAVTFGVVGALCAVAGYYKPEWGSF